MTTREVLLVKNVGGGGAPAGSAVITDSVGSLAVQAVYDESNLAQIENNQSDISVSNLESNPTPTEVNDFQAFIDGGNEAVLGQFEAQVFELSQQPVFETIAAQVENALQDIAASYSESNVTPDETNSTEIMAAEEVTPTPNAGHSFATRMGAASVAASAPQSGGQFSSPNNATGIQDAVYASVVTAAGASTSTKGGTLDFTYPAVGSIANETQTTTTVTINAYGSMAVGTLATGSLTFFYSTNSGSTWTQIGTAVTSTLNFNTTPLTGTVTLDVGANLSTFRTRLVGSVTNSLTGAVNIYIDSVELVFAHVGRGEGTPADIPNLANWYDSQSAAGTADNTQITSLHDKTLSRKLTGTATYRSVGTSGQPLPATGVPVLFFNGGQALVNTLASTSASEVTIFVVDAITANNGDRAGTFAAGNVHDYQDGFYYGPNVTTASAVTSIMDGGAGATDRVIATNYPLGTYKLYTSVRTLTTINAFLNGVPSPTFTKSSSIATRLDTLKIGSRSYDNGGGGPPIIGCVGEAIIFTRALTTAERQKVEYYLRSKWGLL